jgi:hypothetical protein
MNPHLREVATIVSGTVPACEDIHHYLDDPRPMGDLAGSMGLDHLLWMINCFITDIHQKTRILGALRGVDEAFRDIEKFSYEKDGVGCRFSPELINHVKHRVLRGFFPHIDEIIAEAAHGNPARAKSILMDKIPREAWREKSQF